MGYIQRKVHSTFLIQKAFWNAGIDGERCRGVPSTAKTTTEVAGTQERPACVQGTTFAFLFPLLVRLG